MDVLVFGAGSLGSLIGGLLAREHAVTLVGRDPHVRAIRRSGLRVTGAREFTVRPAEAITEVAAATADLALVTVKAFDTGAAADALAGCDLGAVLSLQNGMGNEERLAERIPAPVLAGTTTYGALRREPGVVTCTGIGTVTLGPHAGADRSDADRAAEAFRAVDIEAAVQADMRRHLWEKLAVNAGVNPVTALARVENGALLEGPAAALAERAAAETATVAREHGIDLTDGEAREALQEVAAATAANVSSMRQDVEAGRRTEIDAINGFVVDRADAAVPVNRTLAALVRTWEAGRDRR